MDVKIVGILPRLIVVSISFLNWWTELQFGMGDTGFYHVKYMTYCEECIIRPQEVLQTHKVGKKKILE